METKEIWDFILRQFKRCEMLLENKDYRGAIDLIYDIADNISNLYKYIEEGNITSDKGKLLNNLSLMFRKGIFREDFGLLLREK